MKSIHNEGDAGLTFNNKQTVKVIQMSKFNHLRVFFQLNVFLCNVKLRKCPVLWLDLPAAMHTWQRTCEVFSVSSYSHIKYFFKHVHFFLFWLWSKAKTWSYLCWNLTSRLIIPLWWLMLSGKVQTPSSFHAYPLLHRSYHSPFMRAASVTSPLPTRIYWV